MLARRSLGAGAVAGPSAAAAVAAPPVVELHPVTKRLRKMWKFAAVCQFLFVFDEAFGMSGFETELLEADFENNEINVVPDLIKRLLYSLTLDRTIDFDNWQHHLRTQYNLRDEDAVSRFGTAEQPMEWAQLSLEDKIATLHDLCEWQLMDPERFRKLVKSEEDVTTWRVSPIGWDAHDNAYWLFDDNRIWIQRPEPQPKAPAKPRAPAKKGSKRARMEAAAARRAASAAAKPSPASKSSGNKRSRPSDVTPSSTPSKRTRSSLADSTASTPSKPPPRRGTRTSARFAPQEDESTEPSSNGRASRSAAASAESSDSELSEPPETMDDDEDNDVKVEDADAEDNKDNEEAKDTEAQEEEQVKELEEEQDEWVEFEAIVVTRQEWLHFAQRFAKSKDPNEKNLHQFINNEILNQVLAAMDEIERQRALELALANRKRSSRIAMKESEREERERDREARTRMEEKMALIRKKEEAKRHKEQEEQEAQKSRETRLREREERLRARELELETKAIREEEERERREREREERKRRREEIIANGGIPPPSKDSSPVPEDGVGVGGQGEATEEEEEWELNCEVCGKVAISPPDEDDEIVCCEQCGVWQHIKCWDSFDKQILGLKKRRDWENVDFFCSKCLPPADGTPVPHPGILSQRAKASPRSNNRGPRSSNDPESPSRKFGGAAAAGNGESPRQRIKLVSSSKNAEAAKTSESTQPNAAVASAHSGLVKPPMVPSQVLPSPPIPSQTLRPPTTGAQPTETGVLTSSGAATTSSPATAPVGQLPPPSSHAVPTAGNGASTVGRPLLPSPNVASNANAGDPSKPGAAPAPANKATNGAGAPGTGLGMGRPSQTPQFSGVGSPHSPSSGGGVSSPSNGTGPMSPRSPSYGATLGSPGLRRPSQPSGSFPMRHTPAKSPLSRPYESPLQNGDPPANGFSLGPPRASSPSVGRGVGQFTSLGASAQSLHPSSAAVPKASAAPGPATAVGSVAGGAFAPTLSEAPALNAASTAQLPAPSGSRTRPHLSSTGSDGPSELKKEPIVSHLAVPASSESKKAPSAATHAFHTLEHGLPTSPPQGAKTEKRQDAETKSQVVELPPTHVQSP